MSTIFRNFPYNITMSTLSLRLKELRKEHNLSQKELANIIKTNNSSVCDWERGRTEPSVEMIINICKYFDISADYLLGLED